MKTTRSVKGRRQRPEVGRGGLGLGSLLHRTARRFLDNSSGGNISQQESSQVGARLQRPEGRLSRARAGRVPEGAVVVPSEFVGPDGIIDFTKPGAGRYFDGQRGQYFTKDGEPLTFGMILSRQPGGKER